MNGKIHEPNYLRVEWGAGLPQPASLTAGWAASKLITPALTEMGPRLRAKLTVSLIADM